MKRQDKHLGSGEGFQDLPRGFQAIQFRHADIHHHNVGLRLFCQFKSLPAVGRLRTNFPFGTDFQKGSHTLPHDLVIIRHQDTKRFHLTTSGFGITTRTVVPRRLESISSRPPSCLARSLMPIMPTPSCPLF